MENEIPSKKENARATGANRLRSWWNMVSVSGILAGFTESLSGLSPMPEAEVDVGVKESEPEIRLAIGECQAKLVRRSEGSESARYIGAFASPAIYRGLQASRSSIEWAWQPKEGLVEWIASRAPSAHVLLTGASGSGKSTLAKSLVRQFSPTHSVVVLDPANEYAGAIESVGGRAFSSRHVSLSLFELESGVSPAEKSAESVSIIRNAMPAMGDQQAYFLTRFILSAFERKGITSDKSTWRKRPPSLADVLVEADECIASRKRPDPSIFSLKRRLDSLVLSGVFGARTELPFSVVGSQPMAFSLKELRSLEAQVIFVEVFLRKLYAFNQRQEKPREIIAVIDEAQSLCRSSDDFRSYIGAICAGGRKYSIGTILISQGFDGLDPAIPANAAAVFSFFSREPKDCEYAAGLHAGTRFGLKAQAVLEELHSLAPYECLFSCTGSGALVRVAVAAPPEASAGERKQFVRGSQHQLVFFEKLCELLPNERIIYNDWKTLEGFECDMTLPERKIAIELDGAPFHSSPEQKERDAKKDALLAEKGWRVIRVLDDGLSFKELEEKAREVADLLSSDG